MRKHKNRPSFGSVNALAIASQILWALDTPRSMAADAKLHSDHLSYVNSDVNPEDYQDAYLYFLDKQSYSLLSKFPGLDTKVDRKKVALEKFRQAEDQCLETNERFRRYWAGDINPPVDPLLFRVRQKISDILGDVPSIEDLDFRFGPGATFGVRRETAAYNKLTSKLECTYAFQPVLQQFLEEFPGWIEPGSIAEVRLVPGSELTFVPKNAKTDRPICIEPTLNGLFQKGIGSHIRERLRRHGIDLRDQGINQNLAQKAYSDHLATVDFSSASDTISYNVVMDLLPIDWFEFLDLARCPRYQFDGKWENFHKFTSMGNAYTFELESLIFYACAFACVEEVEKPITQVNLGVYGDDVIIPARCFERFQALTKFLGFSINTEKSFSQGQFYESCGQDFFAGILVRPFQLKKDVNNVLDFNYVYNQVKRLAYKIRNLFADTRRANRLLRVCAWLLRCGPGDSYYLWGPEGYGDGHLIGPVNGAYRCADQIDGFIFRTYVEVPILVSKIDWPSCYPLYHAISCSNGWWDPIQPGSPSKGYSVRGRTTIKKVSTHTLGGWNSLE